MNEARTALEELVRLKRVKDALTFEDGGPAYLEYEQGKEAAWKTAFAVVEAGEPPVSRFTSDGYHTFDELYEFRKLYNAALFNEWAMLWNENKPAIIPKYDVHKSWRHHDGELCFGGGWFIVVAMLPTGQITNHYKKEDWDLFQVPEVDKAKYEFDGHTPADVLDRLRALTA